MEEINKYIEAPSVYTNKEDFIREFTNEYNKKFEVHWGMDFTYKGKEYHFARYPAEDNLLRKLFEKELGHSLEGYIYEMILNEATPNTIFSWDDITIIGFYKDINDVLTSNIIDNRPFEEILLSSEIKVTGKD